MARTDKSCILQCALWKRWYGLQLSATYLESFYMVIIGVFVLNDCILDLGVYCM